MDLQSESMDQSESEQEEKTTKEIDSSSSESESDSNNEQNIEVKKLKYKCTFNNCNQYFRREKDLDKHEFQHNGLVSTYTYFIYH